MQNSREPDFFVADWRICPDLGRLEHEDVAVSVEPRSMQVLACLARHAPNIVSKQRLIHEVWGDAFVTEEVLSHAVWELRKAFGDEAKNPRYIQTIARKGYRLLAPVTFRVAAEPLAPGCRIAQYEILELLGAGAMGEVYKARDQRLGREVALKFLPADLTRDPSARRRFLHEAQAVALLDHPNVATIYEVGESEGGRAYLALAFYEGETLQQKLERGPLPLAEAVGIARQIARGLGAAHRRQIVHRDVKPANIVVLPDGTVKLLDFGLAKMIGATSLTRLGASPGTPAYKSPEQTRGEKVDPRSDLWAVGVVLYEMVTGRQPFGGEYEQAMIYSILNETPKPLGKELPPELSEVIDRALKKDPAERYATAEELKEDLEVIPLDDAASGRARPRRRVTSKWKRLAAGLAALVVLGIILGAWYRWEHRWDFSPEVARLIKQGEDLEWRGDSEQILGNAESAFRRALRLDPQNPRIMAQLAALLSRAQAQFPQESRLAEIRRLTAEAVGRAPEQAMPWVAQAKLLLLEGNAAEAEKAARKAVQQDPELDRGYTVLGEAIISEGRLDEGLEEIRRGTEVGQGYLRARLILGIRLKNASRYDEAAVELRKVLQYDRDHPTATQYLGECYLERGLNLAALPLFLKVFRDTGDARAANSLGNVYLNLGQLSEAIQYFNQAYRLKPHPITARNLAEAYEKGGQLKEAHRWYALALDGFDRRLSQGASRPEPLYVRSFCAAKLGRFDEAFANIEEAMRLKPKENRFLFRAAQVCALAGRREEVYSYVRRAILEGYSREEFSRDFVFKAFQDDPRFRALLEAPER
jgi:serine/threonine-protein kinase